jgi:hypothetical protein
MLTTSSPRRGNLALQISVLVVFLFGTLVVLYTIGAFKPRSAFPHKVTYRVAGTAGMAFVTYTKSNGVQTERLDVTLPWQVSVIYPERTTVILTAGNPTQRGELECNLLLNGQDWKQDRAGSPSDKVACGGVVR